MGTLTPAYVFRLARGAGLSRPRAVIATAIAMAESGLDPGAEGDVALADATWGPSLGLWQIRSVRAQTGTGRARDAQHLRDPAFNAVAMDVISNHGTDFSPWSVYKSGAYRQYLDEAEAAARGGPLSSTPATPGSSSAPPAGAPAGGGVSVAGIKVPGIPGIPGVPDPGDVLGGAGDLLSGIGGGALDVAQGVVGLLVKELAPAVLIGAGVLGGFAIIAIGLWRGTEETR